MGHGHDPEPVRLLQINEAVGKPAHPTAARADLAGQSERGMPSGQARGEINGVEKPITEKRSGGFVGRG